MYWRLSAWVFIKSALRKLLRGSSYCKGSSSACWPIALQCLDTGLFCLYSRCCTIDDVRCPGHKFYCPTLCARNPHAMYAYICPLMFPAPWSSAHLLWLLRYSEQAHHRDYQGPRILRKPVLKMKVQQFKSDWDCRGAMLINSWMSGRQW